MSIYKIIQLTKVTMIYEFKHQEFHITFVAGGIVDLLLTNGAIPDTRNRKNLTPRQVASNVQVTYLLDKAINDRVEQAHMRTQDPQPRRVSTFYFTD